MALFKCNASQKFFQESFIGLNPQKFISPVNLATFVVVTNDCIVLMVASDHLDCEM